MRQLRLIFAALFLISPFAANADLIVVDYQFTNSGYEDLSGSFSGTDTNNDGVLAFVELVDWFTNWQGGAIFSSLNDLGDFDYTNNVWFPNGLQWNQSTEDAYMTWNNWAYSASTSNSNWTYETSVTRVPEPGILSLLLIGLAGIGLSRRNRQV